MNELTSYSALESAVRDCRTRQTRQKRPQPSVLEAKFSENEFIAPKPESTMQLDIENSKKTPENQSPSERLKRSRERNRVHARKTRQRKKEQMLTLQTRADELKQEQVRLKQSINEKNTASILVGLFANAGDNDVSQQADDTTMDPKIETLLRRPAEEIPDASKITELPALILPGQHNSKKAKALDVFSKDDLPDDGIDYQLLGKDRSQCTPEELDKIRRERNRMHAKRTRDRKRLFMEEMSDMCKQLEDENALLRNHLRILDGGARVVNAPADADSGAECSYKDTSNATDETPRSTTMNGEGAILDQLKTLIEVAGSFENNKSNTMKGMMSLSSVASSVATAVSASDSNISSTNESVNEEHESLEDGPSLKRRRLGTGNPMSMGVPQSIAI